MTSQNSSLEVYLNIQMFSVLEKALSVSDLSVGYQDKKSVVRNVSFDILRGQTLCLVGESGSGKTTIARAVVGLSEAWIQGDVRIDGTSVFDLDRDAKRRLLKKKVSFIFQDPFGSLVPILTVGTQMKRVVGFRNGLRDKTVIRQRCFDLLARVGMSDAENIWNRTPAQLSGGMCQRIMIAMAMCVEPVLVFADEPTSALDAMTQETILSLLQQLQGTSRFGMLFITHDMRLAAKYSDMVAVLYNGEIIELNEIHRFIREPKTEYAKQLLESAKRLSVAF
ncbi:ABC transporter ATP-binding protein [candidate division KSB1 bacterium]|nr:ABC transporter ATP-binding protein [candidate division KSB1 bacterium]